MTYHLVGRFLLSVFLLWRSVVVCELQGDPNLIIFDINEKKEVNSIVGNIRPRIRPQPESTAKFSIVANKFFDLSDEGLLTVKSEIDRDTGDKELCVESGYPRQCIWSGISWLDDTRLLSVKVVINDINDNKPFWTSPPSVTIPENFPIGKTKEFPLATDRDYGNNGIVRYGIKSETRHFSINNVPGPPGSGVTMAELVIKSRLDREDRMWHNITIFAVDGAEPIHTGSTVLTIRISDENDNYPAFGATSYNRTVDENLEVGSSIDLRAVATDADEGDFSRIRYKFALSTPQEIRQDFLVESETGLIRIKQPLDYSRKQEYKFQLIAEDGGSPSKTAATSITIKLRDTNNNPPVITVNPSTGVKLKENMKKGNQVATFTVKDRDTGINGQFTCELSSNKDFRLVFLGNFRNQMTVYRLVSQRSFDREHEATVRVSLRCVDKGEPSLTGTEIIMVEILDENDNPPVFQPKSYAAQMQECNTPNFKIDTLKATDLDEGNNSRLVYKILWPLNEQDENPFTINHKGELIATKILDRETRPQGYEFKVLVQDSGVPSLNDTADVKVALIDFNDESPQFTQSDYSFYVDEDDGANFTIQKSIGYVRATDGDAGPNNNIKYYIRDSHKHPFEITASGQIRTRLNHVLDRELSDQYLLQVVAEDQAIKISERLSSTAKVFITVKDLNDNAPTFLFPNATNNLVHVSYKEKRNFVITKIVAHDRDSSENGKIRYLVSKGNLYGIFHLRAISGELAVGEKMKNIHMGTYQLTIQAVDRGTPSRSSTVNLKVVIDNSVPIGDNLPIKRGGAGSGGQFFLGLETNKLIIIGILVGTAVISAILITLISIMARRTPFSGPCSRNLDDLDQSPNKEGVMGSPTVLYQAIPSTAPPPDLHWGEVMNSGANCLPTPAGTLNRRGIAGIPATTSECLVQTSRLLNNHSAGMETFLGPTHVRQNSLPHNLTNLPNLTATSSAITTLSRLNNHRKNSINNNTAGASEETNLPDSDADSGRGTSLAGNQFYSGTLRHYREPPNNGLSYQHQFYHNAPAPHHCLSNSPTTQRNGVEVSWSTGFHHPPPSVSVNSPPLSGFLTTTGSIDRRNSSDQLAAANNVKPFPGFSDTLPKKSSNSSNLSGGAMNSVHSNIV